MATHTWHSSRVKNDYSPNFTIINNITQTTVDDVEVLTAEASESLINDSITAFQAQISVDFNALVATVNANALDIADNAANLTNHITNYNGLVQTVNANSSDIADNASNLTNHITNYNGLVQTVNANILDIANNTANLASHINDFDLLNLKYTNLTT